MNNKDRGWSLRDIQTERRMASWSWVDIDYQTTKWQVWCEPGDYFAIEAKSSIYAMEKNRMIDGIEGSRQIQGT